MIGGCNVIAGNARVAWLTKREMGCVVAGAEVQPVNLSTGEVKHTIGTSWAHVQLSRASDISSIQINLVNASKMSPPWKQNWLQKLGSDLLFGKPTPEQQFILDRNDRILENIAQTNARIQAADTARTLESHALETSSSSTSTSQSEVSSEPEIFPCGECSGRTYAVHSQNWLSDPKTHLRILKLEKGVGREAIHGKLLESSISSKRSYETLSYRWENVEKLDDPRDAAHIHIDSEIFPVSDSVLEALYILRKSDRSRKLWIDQICIVQEPHKLDEKSEDWKERQGAEMNEQVKVMGQIYSNSAHTIIWLGSNVAKDELAALGWIMAFKPFREQLEQYVERESVQKAIEDGTYISGYDHIVWKHNLITGLSALDGQTLQSKGITEAETSPWLSDWRLKCILKFYQRPWFVRTWPVQEVVLSKKKTVYIGDTKIDWASVGWYSTYFMHHFKHLDIEQDQLQGLEAAMWVDYYVGTYTDGFSLATMLRATRRYETGDPRDKLYALLGMIDYNLKPDGSRYDSDIGPVRSVPEKINVNKKKEPAEVYYDVACYLLEKDHDLQMLAAREYVCLGEELPSPSWVPRWDKLEKHTHIWLPTPGAENFQACSQLDPWISFHTSSKSRMKIYVCEVHGIKAAKVTQIFDYMGDWGSLAQVISNMVVTNLSECDDPQAEMAMVLTAGRAGDGYIVDIGQSNRNTETSQHIDGFSALLMDLEEYQEQLDRTGQGLGFRVLSELTRKRGLPSQYKAGEARKSSYGIRCQEGLRNRSVFRTNSGRFGVGPACMRKGDDVFILRGGKVPFILRKTEEDTVDSVKGTHQLVGECYLRGAMNGEFDKRVKDLGTSDGDIYLV